MVTFPCESEGVTWANFLKLSGLIWIDPISLLCTHLQFKVFLATIGNYIDCLSQFKTYYNTFFVPENKFIYILYSI